MRRAARAGMVVLAIAALAAYWPAPRADVSPLFQRTDRPPHPRSVYYPPGEPAPKVPGDPGYVHP